MHKTAGMGGKKFFQDFIFVFLFYPVHSFILSVCLSFSSYLSRKRSSYVPSSVQVLEIKLNQM